MSKILGKLAKKTSEKCLIKNGQAVILENQIQFNKLAEISNGQFQEDSIYIDGVYVATTDDIGAINIVPISDFCEDIENIYEAFSHKNLKEIDFDKWYKKFK